MSLKSCLGTENDLSIYHLEKNDRKDWHYPKNIQERISKPSLNWGNLETIFRSIPDSKISKRLRKFFIKYN